MTARNAAVLAVALFIGVWWARPQTIPEWLSLLVVVVAAPLCWLVAFDARDLLREAPDLHLLRAAVILTFALATIVTVFAAVFLNNSLVPPPLNLFETQLLTRGTILVVAGSAALYWRHTRNRLRRRGL